MVPTAFDEENAVLGPPQGVSSERVESLSVCRTSTVDGVPVVISCWKPSKEELEEIQRTGRVWLTVYGETMPPVALSGFKPFVER